MFEIDTTEDAQLILPKKNTVSRFQQGSGLASSGSKSKRSLRVIMNQPQSKIVRKLDFGNDQDTLTAFPDISAVVSPSVNVRVPSLADYVYDFKNMNFSGSNIANKSSLKSKKSNFSQIEESEDFSNGSPLRPLNANTINYQDGNISQTKRTKFFQKSEKSKASNSNVFNFPPNPVKKENTGMDKRQNNGNETGVKIIRPSAQINQNFDANSTKTIDLTENDTYFKNLIQKDKLIDFSDIENESGFTNNNNSNNSLAILPQKNKKQRKPLAPKVYDDDEPTNKNDTSNIFSGNPNDDDTNTNNLNSIILPKKSVKFGGKKNNAYDTNNSIDTMFIAQTISKQPMLANLNPDETNTNMNMSFNLNGSLNNGNGRKNNVRFINSNRNNEPKEAEFPNFNNKINSDFNENYEEDNDVTKADIDPEFESEHSAILPPHEDHTIKFTNNNNNYSTSANNFIFTDNANPSGILKNKNNSRSKLGSSLLQGSGSFIATNNNTSKLKFDFGSDLFIDITPIIECINGLFSNQVISLSKDLNQKIVNQTQVTNSIMNRLTNASSRSNTNNIFNIMNDHKEETSKLSSFYSQYAINEILRNLLMLYENKQNLSRKMIFSMKSLKFTISMAIEELHRPKSTMHDVASAISRLEEAKNSSQQAKNNGSEYIEKYYQLKKSIPFKVSSLNSKNRPPGVVKNQNSVLVACSFRAVKTKMELNNAELLHVKVSKSQRSRKLKNEMAFLMTVVPDFFFDGTRFSCVISSSDQSDEKRIRFAIVIVIPSFYPWCFLTVESIRVDFGITFEEVKEKVDSILSSAKITAHPLTDFIQELISEYN